MHYEAPPRRSSAGSVILVVFVLGFFFLVGLAVVGLGVLMFARAESHEVRAIMHRDRALRQADEALEHAEHARAQAAQVRARAEQETIEQIAEVYGSQMEPAETIVDSVPAESPGTEGSIRIAHREITIVLDEGGKIQVDGTACELPQLKESLLKAGQGREESIVVVVKADKRCLFEPVAGVLSGLQGTQPPARPDRGPRRLGEDRAPGRSMRGWSGRSVRFVIAPVLARWPMFPIMGQEVNLLIWE